MVVKAGASVIKIEQQVGITSFADKVNRITRYRGRKIPYREVRWFISEWFKDITGRMMICARLESDLRGVRITALELGLVCHYIDYYDGDISDSYMISLVYKLIEETRLGYYEGNLWLLHKVAKVSRERFINDKQWKMLSEEQWRELMRVGIVVGPRLRWTTRHVQDALTKVSKGQLYISYIKEIERKWMLTS